MREEGGGCPLKRVGVYFDREGVRGVKKNGRGKRKFFFRGFFCFSLASQDSEKD